MKKLYQNIENIYIIGGVGLLTELVQEMDRSLQNVADSTDRLTGYLLRFSGSNSGHRYENIVKTTVKFRDELFDDAQALNDILNQIVQYQNKIYRYEGMAAYAPPANPFLAQKRPISIDTSQVQFHRTDMLQLVASLKNYISSISHHMTTIHEKRNSAGQIWRDSQYRVFSEFVDEVLQSVRTVMKDYELYIQEIEEKIKEMD